VPSVLGMLFCIAVISMNPFLSQKPFLQGRSCNWLFTSLVLAECTNPTDTGGIDMQKMILNILFNFDMKWLRAYAVEPWFKIGLRDKVFVP
jgi:hypothetical protein